MDEGNKLSANLLSLLLSREAEPSEFLKQIIENTSDLNLSVETRVSDMCQIVQAHYIESQPNESEEVITFRLNIAKKLYYRFLDILLSKELSGKQTDQCSSLLSKDIFHKVLFACSIELVNFCFNSSLTFPWILEALHISAYHFCKIIEVIVRDDECLSREMIKHLNWIESVVLERLAWTSDSPLWFSISQSNLAVPKCDEVLPYPIVFGGDKNVQSSPSRCNTTDKSFISDKFMSPIPPRVIRNLNNVLDNIDSLTKGATKTNLITEESSVLKKCTQKIIETFKSGDPVENDKEKPLRSGSLTIFFRKFYLLSSDRIKALCDQLSLNRSDVRQKIWTLYQLVVSKRLHLLIDHHLDQLLMCTVFVMCKFLGEQGINFVALIGAYKLQSQAVNSVYRCVKLSPQRTINDLVNDGGKTIIYETGDLIKYYNDIFIPTVQPLLTAFQPLSDGNMRIALSPLIGSNLSQESPRRKVSDNHCLYVRCLKAGSSPITASPKTRNYCFMQSPIKPLQPIVPGQQISVIPIGKRILKAEEETAGGVSNTQRVKDLISERRYWVVPPKLKKFD